MYNKDSIFENEILKKIAEVSNSSQTEAYVVGGFVRDLILGIHSKDIDIVCIGDGIEFASKVAHHLGVQNKLVVYKNFGTALIKFEGAEIEFVGARKESYRSDSRKPQVEQGTLQDDQNRRDFTINALAISLNKDTFGNLVDPFDGIGDLQNKIIRTPLDPDKTFSDDPLRILRAIRFAVSLGFNIEEKTFKSIKKNSERLEIISKERIHTEFNKTIMTEQPSRGILLYLKSNLLKFVLPEMLLLQGAEVIDGHTHKDNFFHTLQVLDNISAVSNNLWLRWAAILHDIAKPNTKRFDPSIGFTFHGHEELGARMVRKIFKRLKMPLNENMKYVEKLVRLHLRPISLVNSYVTDSAVRRLIYDAGDDLGDLLKLCRADITSKNPITVKKYLNNFDIVEEKIKEVEERDKIKNFQPPITGEIIMKTFNLKPCSKIGIIKNKIKDAILDGKIKNDYSQAYEYMLQIYEDL